jgi:hypothetical protein
MPSKEKFEFIKEVLTHNPVVNAAVFSVLRSLKKLNPGDTYYENYLWHYKKRGNTFVDYYHLLWQIASHCPPASVLEIGCRLWKNPRMLRSSYATSSLTGLSPLK